MDPAEWEQMADQIAVGLRNEVASLEERTFPDGLAPAFHSFWPSVRTLNERLRTAPAIKLEDKLTIQHKVNELCQRVRHSEKAAQQRATEQREEIGIALGHLRDSLEEARSIDELREIRADIAAMRERVVGLDINVRREERQSLWNDWQNLNKRAWERLNTLWDANEAYLGAILDSAREHLTAGDVRGAKEDVKAFHEAITAHESSHRALRTLRSRANALWKDANEAGKKKHDAYIAGIARRVQHWKYRRDRAVRQRTDLEREIARLEFQASAATTDVGNALIRGQLAERRRALVELEAEERALEQQIEEAHRVSS